MKRRTIVITIVIGVIALALAVGLWGDSRKVRIVVNNDFIVPGVESYVIMGTMTNRGMVPVQDITIAFNLFDADGYLVGVADDHISKIDPLAPGAQWRYEAIYINSDAWRITQSKLAQITGVRQ